MSETDEHFVHGRESGPQEAELMMERVLVAMEWLMRTPKLQQMQRLALVTHKHFLQVPEHGAGAGTRAAEHTAQLLRIGTMPTRCLLPCCTSQALATLYPALDQRPFANAERRVVMVCKTSSGDKQEL